MTLFISAASKIFRIAWHIVGTQICGEGWGEEEEEEGRGRRKRQREKERGRKERREEFSHHIIRVTDDWPKIKKH